MRKIFISILLLALPAASIAADGFDKRMQSLLDKHYQKYRDKEYFSGIALSVYTPKRPIKSYFAGKTSHEADGQPVTVDTLFQIGSITKSFTAAIVLQLEKEKHLQLSDSLSKWLPEYDKWSSATFENMLNMTSGLPNYSDAPLWNAIEYQQPERQWSNQELVAFAYPSGSFNPPLKTGYFYTNTGYVLTAMIIEKLTGNSFQQELTNRTIKSAKLNHTYYPVPTLDEQAKAHLAQGYNYNQYDNPALLGKNVSNVNLSWAGAAGAIIANSEDVIRWAKALFVEDKVLDNEQKQKLMSLISISTGSKIAKTSPQNPRGFGLGVSEAYSPEMGRYWFYEGETLGFRALFMYIPCNGVIVSSIFNSATNNENDHAGELMQNVYAELKKTVHKLSCNT